MFIIAAIVATIIGAALLFNDFLERCRRGH